MICLLLSEQDAYVLFFGRHCHIAWHASGGLGVTFLERLEDYKANLEQSDVDVLNEQCKAWNEYFPSNAEFSKIDSGI